MNAYSRVYRFFGRLWIALSGLWLVALVLLGSFEAMRTSSGQLLIQLPAYWIFVIGPPICILLIGLIALWVINVLKDNKDHAVKQE